jgi:hypothetical protein
MLKSVELDELKARRGRLLNLIESHQSSANRYAMHYATRGLAQFESNEARRYR